jgi:hypothetical protein
MLVVPGTSTGTPATTTIRSPRFATPAATTASFALPIMVSVSPPLAMRTDNVFQNSIVRLSVGSCGLMTAMAVGDR